MSEHQIIWIAGTRWDEVPGTDRRLVTALAEQCSVLWIDPPRSPRLKHLAEVLRLKGEKVAEGITRVEVIAPYGVTRPGIRQITSFLLQRKIGAVVAELGWTPTATVVAFPLAEFPKGPTGKRILYVTDDWLQGSHLMGFSRAKVKRTLVNNINRADAVSAVSPVLLNQLEHVAFCSDSRVIPNGCPEPSQQVQVPDPPFIGLIGQLNERLDLDILETLAGTGRKIRVVGPRTDQDGRFGRRLDAFLEADNVEWVGRVAPEELPQLMATFAVGLTPYIDNEFNRASFPLKTLEYLSLGVPVVSTDMPATRWLATPHVAVCRDPETFVRETLRLADTPSSPDAVAARRRIASQHSWGSRGEQFLRLCTVNEDRVGRLSNRDSYQTEGQQ